MLENLYPKVLKESLLIVFKIISIRYKDYKLIFWVGNHVENFREQFIIKEQEINHDLLNFIIWNNNTTINTSNLTSIELSIYEDYYFYIPLFLKHLKLTSVDIREMEFVYYPITRHHLLFILKLSFQTYMLVYFNIYITYWNMQN